MLYARAEAASRGVQAVVCSSTDSSTCADSNNWATGRVVRLTSLGASSPSVPKITAALAGTNTLTGTDGSGADVTRITFNPYGGIILGSNTLPLKLTLCSSSVSSGRLITVGANGRPVITRDATCP
jgi:Tfp pilus assembly protein FimT